jgi:hypothetical protein
VLDVDVDVDVDPSGFEISGIQLLTAYRLAGFATKNDCGSYIVSDQKAFTGGVAPFGK